MKKSIFAMATAILIMSVAFTSCNTSSQKVENAENNVIEANEDLDKANQEYLDEIESYRRETADKIAANNRSIEEFNARIENEKEQARAEYRKEIAALEQKNSDMKKKMDDYKAEGKDKWEKFKTEFSRDMDELGNAFRGLTVKNVK